MIISNLLLICHLQALICQSQALHKASLRARCQTRHRRVKTPSELLRHCVLDFPFSCDFPSKLEGGLE